MADGPRADEHAAALATAARLHARGDSAGALEVLPDLVAARPDDLAVRLLLARCLIAIGAPAVARAAAEAAVGCDPSSWQAHVLVAQAVRETDPVAAVAAAEQAVALAPAEPEPHRVLAEATAARGDSGVDALLDPALPDPLDRPHAVTPTLPRALLGVPPEGPPAVEPPTTPAAAPPPPPAPFGLGLGLDDRTDRTDRTDRADRPEPRLPVALGGPGLGGGLVPDVEDDTDKVSTGRLVLRIVGLAGWLLIGFRFGVQGIGGPLGVLLFLAIAAGVAYAARRVAVR